jgi:iron(III) transport system substrate-binding protein
MRQYLLAPILIGLTAFASPPRVAAAQTVTPAASAPQPDQVDDWDQVLKAAKTEGRVVFYTSHGEPPEHNVQLAKLFEQKYGIHVDVLVGRSSDVQERLRSEQTAKRYLADVFQSGASVFLALNAGGAFQQHGYLPNLQNISSPEFVTDIAIPNSIQGYGILVNTRLVPPQDQPKSWQDLLDPRWKGKILADDMRANGSGLALFTALYDKYGEDFHRKLAEQQLTFGRTLGNDIFRVARSEYAIFIPLPISNFQALKGLPVKLVLPPEGVPNAIQTSAIATNPPHPNAARLFMNFLLEPDAQLVYARTGAIPTVSGVRERVDENVRQLMDVKLLGGTDARAPQMIEKAKVIYGPK